MWAEVMSLSFSRLEAAFPSLGLFGSPINEPSQQASRHIAELTHSCPSLAPTDDGLAQPGSVSTGIACSRPQRTHPGRPRIIASARSKPSLLRRRTRSNLPLAPDQPVSTTPSPTSASHSISDLGEQSLAQRQPRGRHDPLVRARPSPTAVIAPAATAKTIRTGRRTGQLRRKSRLAPGRQTSRGHHAGQPEGRRGEVPSQLGLESGRPRQRV